MQDRIKELAIEAGIDLDPHGGICRAYAVNLEQFAQAIARECAEICDRQKNAMKGTPSDGDLIRARFGIATPPGDK